MSVSRGLPSKVHRKIPLAVELRPYLGEVLRRLAQPRGNDAEACPQTAPRPHVVDASEGLDGSGARVHPREGVRHSSPETSRSGRTISLGSASRPGATPSPRPVGITRQIESSPGGRNRKTLRKNSSCWMHAAATRWVLRRAAQGPCQDHFERFTMKAPELHLEDLPCRTNSSLLKVRRRRA